MSFKGVFAIFLIKISIERAIDHAKIKMFEGFFFDVWKYFFGNLGVTEFDAGA